MLHRQHPDVSSGPGPSNDAAATHSRSLNGRTAAANTQDTANANPNKSSVPKSHSSWKILDLLKIQNSSSRSSHVPGSGSSHSSTPPSNDLSPSQSISKPIKPKEKSVNKCICCGTILTAAATVPKFKCGVCHTTNEIAPLSIGIDQYHRSDHQPHLISYKYVRKLVDKCLASPDNGTNADSDAAEKPKSLHKFFEPLSKYTLEAFGSHLCLNNSFKIRRGSRRSHYSTSNIDTGDIRATFDLLTRLPTKRPLYNALHGANDALKRLNTCLVDDPRNISWVLILFEIPFLARALTHSEGSAPNTSETTYPMADVPEIKSLCYEILKRVLGVIASTESTSTNNYLASWMSKLANEEFVAKVELINLYITFHLKKYFYIANNPSLMRRRSSHGHSRNLSVGSPLRSPDTSPSMSTSPRSHSPRQFSTSPSVGSAVDSSPAFTPPDEYTESSNLKEEVASLSSSSPLVAFGSPLTLPGRSNSKKGGQKQDTKIKIHLYGNDWHFKTATAALSTFFKANSIRHKQFKLAGNVFYNSLVDFVNIKLDFDSWQTNKKAQKASSSTDAANLQPELQTVIDYIQGKQNPVNEGASFFFCQYPFLISLGLKIAILEYEARKQMERKAEEAFINSLDKRVALDVYFKVRVRRSYIVQDSLRAIQLNANNLKKSLRVQFIDEPGVDAGGLKKEWFLTLTKELFSPSTGMLVNIEDSNYYWFNLCPPPMENAEIYYLFGSILGLAIYNSTILDLRFPMALYKLLLGLPIGLSDYQELFPESCCNLFKLRNYGEEELAQLDLTFEVTYNNVLGAKNHATITKELIPRGSQTAVTLDNREYYIDKYARFFMVDGLATRIESFVNGFKHVAGGNALSLFSAEEIQLLLCGSDESKLDVEVLKSITKYNGWPTREKALEEQIVIWFWQYLESLSFKQQKKFLLFVTGSDRVPATGIQNLSFKITLMKHGKDSNRLPVAHTCFNELAIYSYSTKEKLVTKLTQAVNESAGFGIK